MTLSAVLGNALAGLKVQQSRLAATADNVANRDTADYRRLRTVMTAEPSGAVSARVEPVGKPGQPDALDDMITLAETGSAFAANAAMFETGADLWDLLSTIKRD